jgi:hypothetical protein
MIARVKYRALQQRELRASQVMAVSRSGTKINGSDPPLPAVLPRTRPPPFLPFFHPPVELPSLRPGGRLYLDRRIDFSAICFGKLVHLAVAEIHV